MFSIHIDTAQTWRGGQNKVLLTVNGLRALGHRAMLVAHPSGELRKRAAEGLELVPIASRSEVDLRAAWRLGTRRGAARLVPLLLHQDLIQADRAGREGRRPAGAGHPPESQVRREAGDQACCQKGEGQGLSLGPLLFGRPPV